MEDTRKLCIQLYEEAVEVPTEDANFIVSTYINELNGNFFSANEVIEHFRNSGIGPKDVMVALQMLQNKDILDSFPIGAKNLKVVDSDKMSEFLASHGGF